jgi:hypothetical protein
LPIFEYECSAGHITEKLFLTFGAAEKEKSDPIPCKACGESAELKEFSVPRPAMFLGNPDGYHRPSPTKRYSTKLATEKGNATSIG